MTEPTVHLNGTGREALRRQYQAAYLTLAPAIEALQQTTPHGRDYYPQDGGRIRGMATIRWKMGHLYPVVADCAVRLNS